MWKIVFNNEIHFEKEWSTLDVFPLYPLEGIQEYLISSTNKRATLFFKKADAEKAILKAIQHWITPTSFAVVEVEPSLGWEPLFTIFAARKEISSEKDIKEEKEKDVNTMAIFRYKTNEKPCQKNRHGHLWQVIQTVAKEDSLVGNPQLHISIMCECCLQTDVVVVSTQHDGVLEAANFLNQYNIIDPDNSFGQLKGAWVPLQDSPYLRRLVPSERPVRVSKIKKIGKKLISLVFFPLRPLKYLDPGSWTADLDCKNPLRASVFGVALVLNIAAILISAGSIAHYQESLVACQTAQHFGIVSSIDTFGNRTFIKTNENMTVKCVINEKFGVPVVGAKFYVCEHNYYHAVQDIQTVLPEEVKPINKTITTGEDF